MLTEADLNRYKRQIIYKDFGEEGQIRLKESHVLIAGAGGLGSPAAIYLACAGIGHITIVDYDSVELSNLNRQVLHWDENLGESKATSAVGKLRRLNPSIEVNALVEYITIDNVKDIIDGVNVVLDAMDNFEARFILNEACVRGKTPLIHAGVHGLLGEITTIIPGRTPCLACILPGIPRTPDEIPVFGATPALVASIQVIETIKLLAGFGDLLTGRMLYVDGEKNNFTFVKLSRRDDCRICGKIIQSS